MSRPIDCPRCGGITPLVEFPMPDGLEPHRDDRVAEIVEVCVGTSLRVASMEFLEAAMRMIRAAERGEELHTGDGTICLRPSSMAVVSTCNRVEFYLAVESDAVEESIHVIHREVFEPAGLAVGVEHEDFVYVHRGSDAVRHLCRVAAGLDSLVVGEHQIAGQVVRGFQRAIEHDGENQVLLAMGEAARRASTRSRSETGIGGGKVSLSSVAVEVAARALGSLDGKRAFVVGSGKVARLVCSSLTRTSTAKLVITNRTHEKAENLAGDFEAQPIEFDELFRQLALSDVVFTATASTDPILTKDSIARAMADRGVDHPLYIIDLAVPRDVAEDVAELDGVHLFGFDELRSASEKNLEGRRQELGRAEAVVVEEVTRYGREREAARAKPLLAAVWQHAERLRASEVDRLFGEFDDVDEATRKRIEHLSRALISKLLQEPSARLRSASAEGFFSNYSYVVRHLFALDEKS